MASRGEGRHGTDNASAARLRGSLRCRAGSARGRAPPSGVECGRPRPARLRPQQRYFRLVRRTRGRRRPGLARHPCRRAGPGRARPLLPVLWGRSMGAAIAVRAAAEDSRIQALVLESPMVDLDLAMAAWFRNHRFPCAHLLWSSGDTIPNCLGEFWEIRESKERTRGRKGPTTLPLCQKVGGPQRR